MANYKGHLVGGFVVTAIALFFLWYFYEVSFSWKLFPSIALIIYTYSLLPDIDHKMSKITWTLLTLGMIFLLNGLVYYQIGYTYNTFHFGIVLIILPLVTTRVTKHRGITHTVWFALITPFLLFLIPGLKERFLLMGIAFFSYWSHLLLDGMPFKLSIKPRWA